MVAGAQIFTATTHDIIISVTPSFSIEKSSFSKSLFFWEYNVRIRNTGPDAVQLISRCWKIINKYGEVQQVDGLGVIGKQPTICFNEEFVYNSGTMLASPSGVMQGHYTMRVCQSNKLLNVCIPLFSLDSPYEVNSDS